MRAHAHTHTNTRKPLLVFQESYFIAAPQVMTTAAITVELLVRWTTWRSASYLRGFEGPQPWSRLQRGAGRGCPTRKRSSLTPDRRHLRQAWKWRGPVELLWPSTQVNEAAAAFHPRLSSQHTLSFSGGTPRTHTNTHIHSRSLSHADKQATFIYFNFFPPPPFPNPISRWEDKVVKTAEPMRKQFWSEEK